MTIVGSMRGTRWRQLGFAYRTFIQLVQDMSAVVISTLTFDENVRVFFKELPPKEALKKGEKLPFGGGGTNFSRALKEVTALLTAGSPAYADYLGNIIFFSDGQGDSPRTELTDLVVLKNTGKPVTINTIACETEDEDDLVNMACALEGQHFNTSSATALSKIFESILNPS
jgi:hypothetical protein